MTIQYETNVDDMDPRLWPHVLDALLSAGALDAWVTPIVMKKGRPAFTLSALSEPAASEAVQAVIFRETTTIGLRMWTVERQVLERSQSSVDVQGQTIGIKRASNSADAGLINTSIEWDDVIVAANELGLAPKDVLAAATAAANRNQ